MENLIEKVIEGESVARVRHVGTVKYKSDKEGFKDQTFERYSYQGEVFRVKSSEEKFLKDYADDKIYKIWLILRKGVKVGVDDKGNDIKKDLWEYDGHINEKSAESKASTGAKLKAIAEGKSSKIEELQDLDAVEEVAKQG
jgi:hypothetical protein